MKKTAKEHFKAMYRAVRKNRHPALIAGACIEASEDFGQMFAIDIAIAARRARTENIQQNLQGRLAYFKRHGERWGEHLPF
ncbi:hypothetical protein [Photobacterium atrarenae]|uniref:Uncharacterized protein n=1 Tax=Photobacterium atrarenae TaxID=865757 RepID=A0ABY5GE87_9GAMM|nr:hypothetical protein [Photobacterium atrarenae]UTV27511.1 hypothetical protein NNL38_14540 [Photobacterium atrarenae]